MRLESYFRFRFIFAFFMLMASQLYSQDDVQQPKNSKLSNKNPVATFTWNLGERYSKSWAAWNHLVNNYDEGFLKFNYGVLSVTGCTSSGGNEPIVEYKWNVRGIDEPTFSFQKIHNGCKLNLEVPRLKPGRYNVMLTIKTKSGKIAIAAQTVKVKDWLIVSLGDSFSSGEGNPDVNGDYDIGDINNIQMCKSKIEKINKEARWMDRGCHRSKFSAPAMAADRLERIDPRSSVTFISFACSGAETKHLISDPFSGQDPQNNSDRNLIPQIDAVKAAVGNRTIDALIISIGINDINFSSLLKNCGNPANAVANFLLRKSDPCVDPQLHAILNELDAKYDRVARKIRQELNVKEVYILQYPVNIFTDKNGNAQKCECLSLGPDALSTGLSAAEVSWLGMAGQTLNKKIKEAAKRHNWNYIYGVQDKFIGRGYCESASTRYLLHRRESLYIQGEKDGAMHPNKKGHKAVSDLLVNAIELNNIQQPKKRVTIRFQKIISGLPVQAGNVNANFQITIRQAPKAGFKGLYDYFIGEMYTEFINMNIPANKWIDLPDGKYSFSFDVFPTPQPLRVITDFDIAIVGNGINLIETNFASKPLYGKGIHKIEKSSTIKHAGIQYTVNISDLPNNGAGNPKTNEPVQN